MFTLYLHTLILKTSSHKLCDIPLLSFFMKERNFYELEMRNFHNSVKVKSRIKEVHVRRLPWNWIYGHWVPPWPRHQINPIWDMLLLAYVYSKTPCSSPLHHSLCEEEEDEDSTSTSTSTYWSLPCPSFLLTHLKDDCSLAPVSPHSLHYFYCIIPNVPGNLVYMNTLSLGARFTRQKSDTFSHNLSSRRIFEGFKFLWMIIL